jgi:hypothetical protein
MKRLASGLKVERSAVAGKMPAATNETPAVSPQVSGLNVVPWRANARRYE